MAETQIAQIRAERKSFEERYHGHRFNDAAPFHETGYELVESALSEASALLHAIEGAADGEGTESEFSTLNSAIRGRAFAGVQRLIALAHFSAREAQEASRG